MDRNDDHGKQQPATFKRATRRRAPRSDAARNRSRLLEATRALLEGRAFKDVTTDEITAAAGVGKGTLYRAFGDKSGVARALVDEEERALQEAILTGSPPLGPGSDVEPLQRIEAFVGAYAALLERNADLLLAADAGTTTRFRTGAYGGWVMHLRSQLRRLGNDIEDESAAHATLALLAPDLHVYLRREAGYSAERFATEVAEIATRISGDRSQRVRPRRPRQ